ncbi:hypothetical protein BKA93DRAFT_819423 [Sparassis latifolia]
MSVEKRWKSWKRKHETQSQVTGQLEWEAHVVEYVPLLGPQFLPPSYEQYKKCNSMPNIVPEIAYLKPVNVIHPFYFPELARCPQCNSDDVKWTGWTTTGHRETALGFQLRCQECAKKNVLFFHNEPPVLGETTALGNSA